MKKLYCLLLSATLALISMAPAYAQNTTSKLKSNIVRKLSEREKFYMTDRVKTMCEEWPGCRTWVEKHEGSFRVVDAEVERWLNNWEGVRAIWLHRLYLQTQENGQIKVYRFEEKRESPSYTYPDPVEIKKFPGHPITGQPSQHSRYQRSTSNNGLNTCEKWDACKKQLKKKKATVGRAIESQYIHGYDENGNALWTRSLYVQFFYYFGTTDSFVFRAAQKKVGGPYILRFSKKINQCPNYPDFQFLK